MAGQQSIDVAAVIERQRLGRFQLLLGASLLLVMVLDGYDLQAMTFAAPEIIKAWHVPTPSFGPVFSAGLLGLMLGAIAFSHVGDRHGRKRAMIAGVLIFSFITLLTPWATSLRQLILLRFLAGFGVGGVYPNALALNAEYTPKRYQATALAVMFIGYTLGAAGGGVVAAQLMPGWGWPVIFWVGGVPPILAAGLLAAVLPKSARFLALAKGRRDRLARVLRRLEPGLAIDAETRFVVADEKPAAGLPVVHLFRDGRATLTVVLWLAILTNLLSLNFLTSWMPTVLRDAAVSTRQAALATSLFHVGGGIGGIASSRMVDRFGIASLAIGLGAGAPLIILIGTPGLAPPLLMVLVFLAGACVIGCQISLNAVSSMVYPTFIRANGIGWAIAMGRVGAILGPVIGAMLISFGLSTAGLFWFAAVPVLCSAFCSFLLSRISSGAAEAVAAPLAAPADPPA